MPGSCGTSQSSSNPIGVPAEHARQVTWSSANSSRKPGPRVIGSVMVRRWCSNRRCGTFLRRWPASLAASADVLFRCVGCGYTDNADVNAAKNIAAGHADCAGRRQVYPAYEPRTSVVRLLTKKRATGIPALWGGCQGCRLAPLNILSTALRGPCTARPAKSSSAAGTARTTARLSSSLPVVNISMV